MTPGSALPIDEGLLERFRGAGRAISWRPAKSPSRGRSGRAAPRARIAHLNDEEARVEERGRGAAVGILTDSGPVGALVLLLEVDRRGPPTLLTTHDAGEAPGFANGALEARWGGSPARAVHALPVTDLVALARYALA